jgi:hypothetical protein
MRPSLNSSRASWRLSAIIFHCCIQVVMSDSARSSAPR